MEQRWGRVGQAVGVSAARTARMPSGPTPPQPPTQRAPAFAHALTSVGGHTAGASIHTFLAASHCWPRFG